MKVVCFVLGLVSGLATFVIAVVSFLLGAIFGTGVTDNTRPRYSPGMKYSYETYSKQ